MRIITGEWKGRKLFPPKDFRIRPTSDKVKESLFNMIADCIDEAVAIDLFSGTGNLGLEALSRGAKRCYFGDKSRDSLLLTKQNISHCKADHKSVTILGDFDKILAKIPEKADLIFLDPPYHKGLIQQCLTTISELSLLSCDGIIVAEHGTDESVPEEQNGFTMVKERKYGSISISIYRQNWEEQPE